MGFAAEEREEAMGCKQRWDCGEEHDEEHGEEHGGEAGEESSRKGKGEDNTEYKLTNIHTVEKHKCTNHNGTSFLGSACTPFKQMPLHSRISIKKNIHIQSYTQINYKQLSSLQGKI